ncbi:MULTISPECIES: hypothetical protein [Flavobacterium]|uniref:Quinol oxidase subunit 4 n=1 Tax=Flavobacterium suzhouense TaxID=1529638 RepID=A0ABW5NP50_9FLAO|nr:hypothetical protein [Flavobacterium sp. AG291]RDI07013.1 hypothetical protein DEU42_113112 [Flavobacterium sp. AG291]
MKLKTLPGIIMLIALSLTMANCKTTVHTHKTTQKTKVPPGKAKKAAGAKSAKAYTPGHNKH